MRELIRAYKNWQHWYEEFMNVSSKDKGEELRCQNNFNHWQSVFFDLMDKLADERDWGFFGVEL